MQIGVEIIKAFPTVQQRANSVLFSKIVRVILTGIGHPVLESYLALLLSEVGKRIVATTFANVVFEAALGVSEDEFKKGNAELTRKAQYLVRPPLGLNA